MLKSDYYVEPTELDRMIFEKLVPADHFLRQVKAVLDFERFRPLVADCYSPTLGRGAEDPVRLIKLEYLEFQYDLSDREVLGEAQVNVAFRYFLDLALESRLPTSGLLAQFRQRLGAERHQALFDDVVAQARGYGLVKDRLRLKDATHVIANIAIPSTLELVAQTRDRLLASLEPYAPERVAAERARAGQIRRATADVKEAERLVQRVNHLRDLVAWAEQVTPPTEPGETARAAWERFTAARGMAQRVLGQTDHPDQPNKLLSVVDAEARCGKQGAFYDGYQLDISLDADSELITAVDTPPANTDEAANAAALLAHEEHVHGNNVQALSIDSIGFRGDILRTLSDPAGLGLTVYVPPSSESDSSGGFPPEAFHLEDDGRVLVCPAEHEARTRYRNRHDTAWKFAFPAKHCLACPLRSQCSPTATSQNGRKVTKNDYEAEYQAACARAQTEAYAQVRQIHPKVERKLAELVRYHGARRARYWGRAKVRMQGLLTALVVNVKRMVKLVLAPVQAGVHPAVVPA
jgi:transposase